MKKLVLVLGMHRSGTSTLMGILNKMGLPIGDNLMPPTNANPKGYFENMDFVHGNESILRNCNSSWDNVKKIFNSDVLMTSQNKSIVNFLLEKYKNYEVFGVKDPRVCVLLPLYEKVCEEKNIELIKIYTERDKNSVIKSITKRDGFSISKVDEMIEYYKKFIKNPDVSLQYENILINTEDTIKSLNSQFDFLNLNNKEDILDFVDPDLNRNGK